MNHLAVVIFFGKEVIIIIIVIIIIVAILPKLASPVFQLYNTFSD